MFPWVDELTMFCSLARCKNENVRYIQVSAETYNELQVFGIRDPGIYTGPNE